MKRTLMLTLLLVAGLVSSQAIPNLVGTPPAWATFARKFLTMSLLAYIMIEVGREFEIHLDRKKEYLVDYLVAATAATFPWILVVCYFLLFLAPDRSSERPPWMEALLVGRFAAPTSAGVLFSMLAAAGLANTWVYKKTRILAIFDDLDTVLLMIPLQILMVGFVWQLGGVILAMGALLFAGLRYYKRTPIPQTWPWIFGYSLAIVAVSEGLYLLTKSGAAGMGVHIEVLLPAFLLGCAIKPTAREQVIIPGEDAPGFVTEESVGLIISGAFMFLVGLSMPSAFGESAKIESSLGPRVLALHVIATTLLANLGKMFVCFFYRNEARFKDRLAVAIAMFPRGEVGAGVLAVSLSYGISGPMVTVAFLSLALNLVLTGAFIVAVKQLMNSPG